MNLNDPSNHWISTLQQNSSRSASQEIETSVAGVTFENRQAIIRQMMAGEKLLLNREPGNQYDSNAIRVIRANGDQIGYISRHEAAVIARFMDAHESDLPAIATMITGGNYQDSSLGVRIKFSLPDVTPLGSTIPPAANIVNDLF